MAFAFKRTLTVPFASVPNSDQVNFPVLVSFTLASLKTAPNGGDVQNSNGYDIAFYSDSSLTTKLDHEIERYSPTTGELVAWVRLPLLSHTIDTVFYLAYADASISSSQENVAGVWDANFKGVWHLGNGTTLTANDSSGNALHGSVTSASAIAGKIDGGANFDGSTTKITMGNAPSVDFEHSDPFTVSAWVNFDSVAGNPQIIGKIRADSPFTGWNLDLSASKLRCSLVNATTSVLYIVVTGGSTLTTGVWYYCSLTYSGSHLASGVKLYLNGVLETPTVVQDSLGTNSIKQAFDFQLGSRDGLNNILDGVQDEARVSSIVRSDDWIATEYNNQSAPGSFITVGSAQAVSTAPLFGGLLLALASVMPSGGKPVAGAIMPAGSLSLLINKLTTGAMAAIATLARDTFTDTNGTQLTAHTPDAGPAWSGADAGYLIVGNRLTRIPFTIVHAFRNVGTPDVAASATFVTLANFVNSLLIRRVDDANYWELFYTGTGWQLDKVVGAIDNFIGPEMPGSTGTVTLQARGNVITATGPDGSQVSVTDAALNTATGVGLILRGFSGVASEVDDFIVTTPPGLTGAIRKQTQKPTAGLTTPSAAIVRQTNKGLTGATTPAGNLARLTLKRLAAILSCTAALIRNVLLSARSGSVSPAGSVTKQASKIAAASSAPSGALNKFVTQRIAGTLTTAGALTKRALRSFVGAISPSAALATLKSVFLSVSGSVTPTATIQNRANKNITGSTSPSSSLNQIVSRKLVGAITGAGALSKRALFSVAGAISPAATLAKLKAAILSVSGFVSPTAAVQNRVNKNITGSTSPSGSVAKTANKSLAGAVTTAGVLVKRVTATLAGVLAPAAALKRSINKQLAATASPIGSLANTVRRVMAGAISAGGNLVKNGAKVFAGALSPTAKLGRFTEKHNAGSINPQGRITKVISRLLSGLASLTGSLINLTFQALYKLEVDLTDAATYSAAVVDSALYEVELESIALSSITLEDRTR